MSIVVENIKNFFTKRIATQEYVQDEIAKLKSDIIDYLSETGINASINDLEERARKHEITLKELYEIIKPEEENLKKLRTNFATIQAISEAIYKAHTGSKTKTNKKYEPIIDEEPEERTTIQIGSRKRYNELKSLIENKIGGSNSQMTWIFDIETDLPNVPKFEGKTKKDINNYIDDYSFKYSQWKNKNHITKAMVMNRKFNEDDYSNKRGEYGYGI